MSYHLLKLLFSTICDLMTSSEGGDNNAVLSLRNFLTNGLGSRIITMMSSDLDLSVSQPAVITFGDVNQHVIVFFLECDK